MRPDFHKDADQMTVTSVRRFNVDVIVEGNEWCRILNLKGNSLLLSEFLYATFWHSTQVREEVYLYTIIRS
jgi:hypothetical protein